MTEAAEPAGGSYFLSYSRSDEVFALRLAKDVRAQGVSIWVDQLDIRPSERWDRAIERAVRECRGIVVIVSPRSVVSDNVADEISFAIDSGKSVLPVMIERCNLPLRITRMQVIDATGNYQKALQQCVAELSRSDVASSKQSETASAIHQAFEGESLSELKREFSAILGPIASVLVEKAAARASSVHELHRLLSLHIEDEEDRRRFVASSAARLAPKSVEEKPDRDKAAISAAEIAAIAKVLARYIGPIAPVIAKRESSCCRSVEELKKRLAASIPTEADRARFFRQLQSH